MILIDNINFLRKRFPSIWKSIDLSEQVDQEKVRVLPSRSTVPTLIVKANGRETYVHSKYDPIREATQIVDGYERGEYEHVLFYGIGLGYHIEAFLAKYPSISFSLYEPDYDILKTFLSTKSLNKLNVEGLKEIFFERFENDTIENVHQFLAKYEVKKVLTVILPCYERICPENLHRFSVAIKKETEQRKFSLNVDLNFEKRWIINCLTNLPQVVSTPNILHDIDKERLQGKPALLVSAGPSLQYSIDEVREIKEKKLAYIFSVGSAINALLANDIYPDAVCTYDPSVQNYKVFQNIVNEEIDTIPMIFGSTVGFETIQNYPGPKVHMITSQDTVAPLFLRDNQLKELENVGDAPSIAVVTLQLLYKLGFNPVYLVGQNLAYLDNKMYAKGINYDFRPSQLSEQEQKQTITVEDVYGNEVSTIEGFNEMRYGIEKYIVAYSARLEVVNTTKGGAKIKGAPFIPLEEVIKTRLGEKVIDSDWLSGNPIYHKDFLLKQIEKVDRDFATLKQASGLAKEMLEQISDLIKLGNEKGLDPAFIKFDKTFNKIKKNSFYKYFLEPMNRIQYDFLKKRISEVRFERDIIKKAELIIKEFGNYILGCECDFDILSPIWQSVSKEIREI